MFKNLILATALAATLGAPAYAAAPQQIDGSVTLRIGHPTSQAELARQLSQSGYSDIRLTQARPTQIDPRPDIDDAMTGRALDADATPVHLGWNGTAVHEGKRVSILVAPDRA